MWGFFDSIADNPITKNAVLFYGCEAAPATAAKNNYTYAEQWMELRLRQGHKLPLFVFVKDAGHDLIKGTKYPGVLKNDKNTEEQVLHLRLQLQYRLIKRDVRMNYMTNIPRPQDSIATYFKSKNDIDPQTRARLERAVARHIIDEDLRDTATRFRKHIRPPKDEAMGKERVKWHGKESGKEDDMIIPYMMQAIHISAINASQTPRLRADIEAKRRALGWHAVMECPPSYQEEVAALTQLGYQKQAETRDEVRAQAAEQATRVGAKRKRDDPFEAAPRKENRPWDDDDDNDDGEDAIGEAIAQRNADAAAVDFARFLEGDEATDDTEQFLVSRRELQERARGAKRPAQTEYPRATKHSMLPVI